MARRIARSLVVIAVTLAGGCGPGPAPVDGGLDAGSLGEGGVRQRTNVPAPTLAGCPDGSTVTYDTFAQGFFAGYCTRCHASTLSGTARSGAPPDVNLDSHAAITPAIAARVDRVAAAGPTRINTFMPLGDPTPSDGERDLLGEWIACGTP